ncbi:Glycoside hydrolase family 43 [Penicillium capsulatum]|uniref:Glycoside hydrolase family 43 n=1 Tax=Penicillium capsulatum TaxID=69766 RepID=A0A9W9IPJ0_9EURO|nr:Glycoside hydrolase family 43 [Penicillium capsulatum]KAJ6130517.1 Glycoside hydrolase family 43 [Penicillium capsulatum]
MSGHLPADNHSELPSPASSSPPERTSNTSSESSRDIQESKGAGGEESARPTTGLFSRPLTRRKIAIIGSVAALASILIALAIALPIVFTKRHHRRENTYHREANRPVYAVYDFPDPGLIEHNGTWYAYGTNPKKNDDKSIHLSVATSTNFVNWTLHEGYDAMPGLGDWERKINHWAPDPIQRDDGKFVIYYAGESKTFGTHHCVGAAVSNGTDPLGPYTPLEKYIACPKKYGGAIDPSPFKDADSKMYVVYKADGNSVGSGGYCGNTNKPRRSVPLLLQELESDGTTKVGTPVKILDIDSSDGPLVEAPNIVLKNGVYYLFFSSHCYTSPGYNVKYAHSKSLKGTYKRAGRPLLQTGDFNLTSPGGATVSPDGTKIVFHANCGHMRCMYAGAINIHTKNKTATMGSLSYKGSGKSSSSGSS